MKITKYGHACLLVEEGSARVLIDPGAYSSGFEGLTDMDAILITHNHPDHLVVDNIKALLTQNPDVVVLADEASLKELIDAGVTATVVHDGDKRDIGGVAIEVLGVEHAEIHPTIPRAINVGYRIAEGFFYPGDSLTVPEFKVEILAIPAAAPWSKVSETIDYLLAVKPKVAIPVHDGFLSRPSLFVQMLERFAEQAGTQIKVLESGKTVEV